MSFDIHHILKGIKLFLTISLIGVSAWASSIYEGQFDQVTRKSGGEILDGKFNSSERSFKFSIHSNSYRVEIHNITFFLENGNILSQQDLQLDVLRSRRGTFFVNPSETFSFDVSSMDSPVMGVEIIAESWGGYANLTMWAESTQASQPRPPVQPKPAPVEPDCQDQYLSAQSQLNQCNQSVIHEMQRNTNLQDLVQLLKERLNIANAPLEQCLQRKNEINAKIDEQKNQINSLEEQRFRLRGRMRQLKKELAGSKFAGSKYECSIFDRHGNRIIGRGPTKGKALYLALAQCKETGCGKFKWPEKDRLKSVCSPIGKGA